MLKANALLTIFLLFTLIACIAVGLYEGYLSIPASAVLYFGVGYFLTQLSSGRYALRRANAKKDQSVPAKLFTISYCIRVLFTILYYYILILQQGEPYLGGGDDAGFAMTSRALAQDWVAGNYHPYDQFFYHEEIGFITYLASGYWVAHFLGGMHHLTAIFLNVLIGSLIPVYVFFFAKEIYDTKTAYIAGMLATFYPELIHYSIVFLRDIVVSFLVLFAVRHFYLCYRKHLLRNATLSASAIFFAHSFRYASGEFLLLVLGIIGLWNLISKRGFITKIVAGVVCISLLIVVYTQISPEYLTLGSKEFARVKTMYLELSLMGADIGSVGAKVLELPSPARQIVFTPYYIIAPFPPWHYTNITSIFVGIGAIYWYVLAIFWAIGMFYCIYGKHQNLTLFLINIAYFVILGNTVMDPRHRTQIMPIALIVTAYGIIRYRSMSKKSLVMNSYRAAYVILFAAYAYLKWWR